MVPKVTVVTLSNPSVSADETLEPDDHLSDQRKGITGQKAEHTIPSTQPSQ